MKKPILVALIVATTLPLGACATDSTGDRYGYNNRSRDGYYADRRERREARRARALAENDVIYRDNNGNYYCKRSDGSTGTIVGAIAGGVLGNIIAPGGSKTLGTVLGAAGGAIAGNAIDKNNVRCE
ncbi:MAG TPA: glycine zipper 2TM domain-containing protein [Sphingobium sp.]